MKMFIYACTILFFLNSHLFPADPEEFFFPGDREEFAMAVREGNCLLAQQLLDTGRIDVNEDIQVVYYKSLFNTPPLVHAAWCLDINMMTKLLDNDADVCIKDRLGTGGTPLHIVAEKTVKEEQPIKEMEDIKLLLDYGADKDSEDDFEYTPLGLASSKYVSLLMVNGMKQKRRAFLDAMDSFDFEKIAELLLHGIRIKLSEKEWIRWREITHDKLKRDELKIIEDLAEKQEKSEFFKKYCMKKLQDKYGKRSSFNILKSREMSKR